MVSELFPPSDDTPDATHDTHDAHDDALGSSANTDSAGSSSAKKSNSRKKATKSASSKSASKSTKASDDSDGAASSKTKKKAATKTKKKAASKAKSKSTKKATSKSASKSSSAKPATGAGDTSDSSANGSAAKPAATDEPPRRRGRVSKVAQARKEDEPDNDEASSAAADPLSLEDVDVDSIDRDALESVYDDENDRRRVRYKELVESGDPDAAAPDDDDEDEDGDQTDDVDIDDDDGDADDAPVAAEAVADEADDAGSDDADDEDDADAEEEKPASRRGRRSRRGRGRRSKTAAAAAEKNGASDDDGDDSDDSDDAEEDPKPKRGRRSAAAKSDDVDADGDDDGESDDDEDGEDRQRGRRRRSRRGRRSRSASSKSSSANDRDEDDGDDSDDDEEEGNSRSSRSRGRRSSTGRSASDDDDFLDDEEEEEVSPRSRRRRGGGASRKSSSANGRKADDRDDRDDDFEEDDDDSYDGDSRGRRRSRGGRRGRRGRGSSSDSDRDDRSSSSRGSSSSSSSSNGRKPGNRKMLINATEPAEIRVAVMEGQTLLDYYIERPDSDVVGSVGNIYKGVIQNVEPGIQAAFVDIGLGKNGFLHISDVLPTYGERWKKGGGEGKTLGDYEGQYVVKDRGKHHDGAPKIQDLLKKGQEVLVQVTKSQIGNKGPSLSTYLSIPGRYLVLMPNLEKRGVSRKIEDEKIRRQIKRNIADIDPPKGMGYIARTAAAGQDSDGLQHDLDYLLKLWKLILKRLDETPAPALVFEESDLMIRTIRDTFTNDVAEIVIDDEAAYRDVADFMYAFEPDYADRVIHYHEDLPLFYRYGIEREIQKLFENKVKLKSGGEIVIDQTEALVAIDVNSGKFTKERDAEQTALKTNLEAAEEICRQLRLRDLGGLIINDFIDMRSSSNRRKLEDAMRDHLKSDKAKTKVCRISPLGLVEMTRQRMKQSHKVTSYDSCPKCKGTGYVLSPASQALSIMRQIKVALSKPDSTAVQVMGPLDVIAFVQNERRAAITELESAYGKKIVLHGTTDSRTMDVSVHFDTERGHMHRL